MLTGPWCTQLLADLGVDVSEREDHNPARGALLKWLADVQFNMPDEEIDGIYAEKLKFTVPCVKIKLKPKEKS